MSDIKSIENFIQSSSPDGGFLQSEEWRKFQEAFGRKTFNISSDGFWANIIEHKLPVVGRYFYVPRGPVVCHPELVEGSNLDSSTALGMTKIIELAKKNNAGWVRLDANNPSILEFIKKNWRVVEAPHDMQPKEIFVIDITKSEEDLLAEMKPKTRYNIKIAQKHNISISRDRKYLDDFIRLVKITAKRDKIAPHPDEYYRKTFEIIPEENLKLYLAEFEGKIIAANIIVFYGKFATYLHGASDNEYRNVMAPYLLQWQAILDAKAAGCEKYDFGGVKTCNMQTETDDKNSWDGITRFKTGFSVIAEPIKFPGSYDIAINSFRYNLYKTLQRIRALF